MQLKKSNRFLSLMAAIALAFLMAANVSTLAEGGNGTQYPITITHAFGETVIEKKPERIATIAWGNHDVPLALGIVPVGVSKANYGIGPDEVLHPWTMNGFAALGETSPNVFDDTDGLDYEAINDAQPDVILAAYSGITQEEYERLSEIAPVVAYPTLAWQTGWREQIFMDAQGMGLKAEGEALVASLDQLIAEKTAAYPKIQGKKAAFFWFSPTDLGNAYIYMPVDPRAAYLTDLGLVFPDSIYELAGGSDSFAIQISAENYDKLADLDIIITYGDETLLAAMQADPLAGSIPAVKNGAVIVIEDGSYLSASSTPSALSIPANIDEYLALIALAAEKVQ